MTLTELAAAADVTPRTVRYYIAQGLLPPPVGAGPAASYGEDHLRKLGAIKAMQGRHLPLSEIRARLDGEPPPSPSSASKPGSNALDYLDNVLGRGPSAPTSTPAGPVVSPAATPSSSRSTWERHAFGPDVELHVRRPLSREQNRRVDRLLDEARRIFLEKP